jgi:hypothetical protein
MKLTLITIRTFDTRQGSSCLGASRTGRVPGRSQRLASGVPPAAARPLAGGPKPGKCAGCRGPAELGLDSDFKLRPVNLIVRRILNLNG